MSPPPLLIVPSMPNAPPALTTPPDMTLPSKDVVCRAEFTMTVRAALALSVGLTVLTRPATPLTNGAAAEVPLTVW